MEMSIGYLQIDIYLQMTIDIIKCNKTTCLFVNMHCLLQCYNITIISICIEGSSYFSPFVICRSRVEMKNFALSVFPRIISILVTFSSLTLKISSDQTCLFMKAQVGRHTFSSHYFSLCMVYMFPMYISFYFGLCSIYVGMTLYPFPLTIQNMFLLTCCFMLQLLLNDLSILTSLGICADLISKLHQRYVSRLQILCIYNNGK